MLHDGVIEGRRTFANVLKCTLILPLLPKLPVQILLNNLTYDMSEVPIALDRIDAESADT